MSINERGSSVETVRWIYRKVDGWMGAFVPEELAGDIEKQRQAYILIGCSWILAFAATVALVTRLMIGTLHPLTTGFCVLSIVVFSAAPWILFATRSIPLAGFMVLGFLHPLVLIAGWTAGGIGAPVITLGPLLPFLSILMLGPRGGVFSALAVVAGGAGMVLAPTFGVEVPTLALDVGQSRAARLLILGVGAGLALFWGILADRQRNIADLRWLAVRERYRRMFEHSRDAVVLTTADGLVVDANPAAVELYGFPNLGAMTGRNAREIYIDPAERERLLEILETKGFVRSHETYQRSREGHLLVIQGTTTALRDRQGKLEFLLSILRDVTHVRQAKADREALLAELAVKNKDLERFTFTVSHDLKSPLITIRGFLGFLERDLEAGNTERVSGDIHRIVHAVDQMAQVLDDLLDLSRLGGHMVDQERFSAVELLAEVEEILAGKILELGVRIEKTIKVESFVADRRMMRLIFQNLIENAIKFSSGVAEPKIWVSVRAGKQMLSCSVADQGIGISPEHLETIFGLFEKLDSKVPGSGIGLANVRRAVELQGGTIWVESPGLGQGSTFFFDLPLGD